MAMPEYNNHAGYTVRQNPGGGAQLTIRTWGKDSWEGSQVSLVLPPEERDRLVAQLLATQ